MFYLLTVAFLFNQYQLSFGSFASALDIKGFVNIFKFLFSAVFQSFGWWVMTQCMYLLQFLFCKFATAL